MTDRQQKFREILQQLVMNEYEGWQVMYEHAIEGDAHYLLELASFVSAHLEIDPLWLLEEAAEQGNSVAYYELGNYYYERVETESDLVHVFSYYKKAALAGVADAMNNLADMYLNGEGTVVNEAEAFAWFKKAGALGVAEAKFTLGMMYEQGLGISVDLHAAFSYYEQSAQEGYEEAQYRIGMIYFDGLLQKPQKAEWAFQWFMKAAEQHQLDAIFNVAYCYEHGQGVEQDFSKAILYYKKASLLGDNEARWRLVDLYEGMDEEQTQRWRRLAEQQEE